MSTITRVNNNDITGTSAVGEGNLKSGFLCTHTVETDYYLFSFFFFWGLCTTILFFSSDQMSNSLSSEEQGCLVMCNVMPLLKTCANNSRLESVGDFDDCYAKKDAQ